MLIEFSVSNFRSFREKQTLSMVAAPRLRKLQNTFKPTLTGEKFPSLLKACVIYGPNASGKSNLLRALETIRVFASTVPSGESASLPVTPFMFDTDLLDKPSTFDIHFIHRGMRYQYELHATSDRIHLERLTFFPRGKESLLYSRSYSESGETYRWGDALEGGSDLHEAWRNLTAPSVLFVSQAVANSNESFEQLRTPHEWLKSGMLSVLGGMGQLSAAAQHLASNDDDQGRDIAEFLQDVDVPIAELRCELQESAASQLGQLSGASRRAPRKYRTTLTHYSALGNAQLPYEDESQGTKNLIGFWLPWTTREPVEFLAARRVLVVDELDSSLHPKIVAQLVAKHLSSKDPTQLIFTTHDTHLMDAKLLRRDQFWITERDENGATQLRSIHDFDGRESEDIEKRYFEGRYRGLPFLRS